MGRARQIASAENMDRILLDASAASTDEGEHLLLDGSAASTDVGFFINTEIGTTETPPEGFVIESSLATSAVTSAKIASDAVDNSKLAVDAQRLANRNMVINGNMEIHQRRATDTHNDSVIDRFTLVKNQLDEGDFTTKHQSITDNPPFSNELEIKCTTNDTSIASNELIRVRYRFEASTLQRLCYGTPDAKSSTLSFYVKTNLEGETFGVALTTQDGTSQVIGTTYTIEQANTWQRVIFNVPGNVNGTINNDTGNGMMLVWGLTVGSQFRGTDNSDWVNNSDAANLTGHTANIASSTDNEWHLTGVQWELGDTATEFEQESFEQNLARCQRYYQKSYNYEGDPGTATTAGEIGNDGNPSSGANTGQMIDFHSYYCEMRTTPTMTFYDVAGTSGKVSTTKHGTNEYNGETGDVFRGGSKNYSVQRPASGNSANSIRWHFEATAEL